MDQSLTFEKKKSIMNEQSFIQTLHNGFNYFQDIKFPDFHSRKLSKTKRLKSEQKQKKSHSEMYQTLQQHKLRYQKLKTQIKSIRETKYNEFIKKSIKYQDLLDINQNKKKQLRTLNKKVGQVVKKNNQNTFAKNYNYFATFKNIKVQGWKPQSREGHTCIVYKESVVLIGGHCSHPFSKINIFGLVENMWMKPIQTGVARSYHTSILYKNKYIITFGGMGAYNASRKCRQCYNNIYLLDLGNNKGKMLRMANQQSVEPRRSHSSALFGKHMIVLGGINTKKEYLNDLVELDLKQLRWTVKQYKIDGIEVHNILSGGIAKHKLLTVFKNRKSYPLYCPQYTQHEGIYVFGGKNRNGTDNILLQICFNKFVPVIKKITAQAQPTSLIDPLVTLKDQNSIIILSGDQYNRIIHLYQIKQQTFINVVCDSRNMMGIGSAMIEYQNIYYLFLGLGQQGYMGSINTFSISQEISQYEINRKKKHALVNEWRNNNLTKSFITSSSQSKE